MYLLKSKKGQFGVLWVVGSMIGMVTLGDKVNPIIGAAYLIGGSLVVFGHMIAYGLSDAASISKQK